MIARRIGAALTMAALAVNTHSAVRYDADLAAAVRDLAARLRPIRGEVPRKIPLAVRAEEESFRSAVRDRRAAALPPSRLAARGRAWSSLGLGDVGDPAALWNVLATDLSGIGFSADGTQLLVADTRLTDADYGGEGGDRAAADLLFATGVRPDEPAVAHMLVHVLQDGRGASRGLQESTDATLAASAWREGEANLVSLLLLYAGLGLESEVVAGRVRPSSYREGDLVPTVPAGSSPAVERLAHFPFVEGYEAAAARVRAGGWSSVERATAASPQTRELLHPDRVIPPPESIPIPDLSLPEGYTLVDRDRLGEFAIGVLLAEGAGKENLGWLAADGWTGDRLLRWERSAEEPGVTVWVSRWEGPADGEEFVYAVERVLRTRYPVAGEGSGAEGERILSDASTIVRIARRGGEVLVRAVPKVLDHALGPLSRDPLPTSPSN